MPPLRRKTPARRAAPRKAQARPRRRALSRGTRFTLKATTASVVLGLVAGGGVYALRSGIAGEGLARLGAGALEATARMGLRVDHVVVTGRHRVSGEALRAALGTRRAMAILDFDPFAAKGRLERLAWVRAATVERRLPDTIYVRLAEREPLALWQVHGRLALIDREGVVITRQNLGRYRDLPLLVGKGAEREAEALLELLAAHPRLRRRVAAAVRVSERRWDLRFANGVTARLPERDAARALATLDRLQRRERLLDRAVTVVDLRLPDRLVVRTAPESGREGAAGGTGAGIKKVPARGPAKDA